MMTAEERDALADLRFQHLVDLQFQRLVVQFHRLGPRPLFELLAELGASHLLRQAIEDPLQEYVAGLDLEVLRTIGGDCMPAAPIHAITTTGTGGPARPKPKVIEMYGPRADGCRDEALCSVCQIGGTDFDAKNTSFHFVFKPEPGPGLSRDRRRDRRHTGFACAPAGTRLADAVSVSRRFFVKCHRRSRRKTPR